MLLGDNDDHYMIIDNKHEMEENLKRYKSNMLDKGSFHKNYSNDKSSIMFTPKNELEDVDEQKLHDEKAKSELRKTMRSAEKKLINQLK